MADRLLLEDGSVLLLEDGSSALLLESSGSVTGNFTADAVLRHAQAGSLTTNAVLRSSRSGSFTSNAVLRRNQTATLTADAVVHRVRAGSATADAVLRGRRVYSLTADASIHGSTGGSFTASAWIYKARVDPDGPGEPGETPLVSIMVDGEDITDDVIFADATFAMQVNGVPGSCKFRVKDKGQNLRWVGGEEVTLDIDGKRKFGGFLMAPSRGLFFPVVDTSTPAVVTRAWILEGVDYNILFTKRIVRDLANPANVALRSWDPQSDSDVVVRYVVNNYTDLPADGITTGGVLNVGTPNPDKRGVIASGGLTFGDAMAEINYLINGVYYIDPGKVLIHVDVDVESAAIGLSDAPVAGESVGYRELEQISDGSKLVNDAMVWGAGLGSEKLVFSRVQDATSIGVHGRWQYGEFTTAMYKQASVHHRADSIVNGSAQSKRGGKDPRESWKVVTYDRRFNLGDKVAIESQVFGRSDVVPIRRMTVTFPTGLKKPRFELILSHEIDLPWNIFESRWPRFGIPKFPRFDPHTGGDPQGGDCICGITDAFNRVTTSPSVGLSDAGPAWGVSTGGTGTPTVHVDGSRLVMHLPHETNINDTSASIGMSVVDSLSERAFDPDVIHSVKFTLSSLGDPAIDFAEKIELRLQIAQSLEILHVFIFPAATPLWTQGVGPTPSAPAYSQITWASDIVSGTAIPYTFFSAGIEYTLSIYTESGTTYGEISNGTTSYRVGLGYIQHTIRSVGLVALRKTLGSYSSTYDVDVYWDDLDIPEITRCPTFYEVFQRTVSNGWGGPWAPFGFTAADASVSPNFGRMDVSAGDTNTITTTAADGPWTSPNGFVMEARFSVNAVPGAGEDVYYDMADDNFDLQWFVEFSTDVALGLVWLGSATNAAFVKTDWSTTEYAVKVQYIPGDKARLKIWEFQNEDEPAGWDLEVNAGPALSAPWNIIHGNQSAANNTFFTTFLDFDYEGRPCFEGGGTPMAGLGRTELVGNGTQTVFFTDPYEPGTTRVFVDGYFQRPGHEYTETNFETGEITFTTAPSGFVTIFCEPILEPF